MNQSIFSIGRACGRLARTRPQAHTGWMRRIGWPVLLAFAAGGLAPAAAQELDIRNRSIERLDNTRDVAALKADAFGDQVNLQNGSVVFDVVDIDIPGNSDLPVQLRRRLVIEDKSSGSESRGALGGRDFDVPYLSGMFSESTGWKVGPSRSDQRCSQASAPDSEAGFSPYEYWHGYSMHIPGGGDGQLLVNPASSLPTPAGSTTYPWITKDFTRLSCLSAVKNGYGGQGFVALTPDGTKYYFDWVVTRNASQLRKGFAGAGVTGTYRLDRKVVMILATKVEDRFGNYVNYTYDVNGALTKIESNDGRLITLTTSGSTTTATSSSGTWTYTEAADNATVTRPDGSQWKYAWTGGLSTETYSDGLTRDDPDCQGAPDGVPTGGITYNVTHPSGMKAEFTIAVQRHPRFNMSKICRVLQFVADGGLLNYSWLTIPNFADTFTLSRKVLTGIGLAPMTWTYTYDIGGSSFNGFADKCATITNPTDTRCPLYMATEVVGPGKFERYRFGSRYDVNEGQLLKKETGADASTILSTDDYAYLDPGTAGTQNFPNQVGDSLLAYSDELNTVRLRPQSSATTSRDGSTFTKQINTGCTGTTYCFDVFARPTNVTDDSSFGSPRTTVTTYADNLNYWVLGQVTKTTVNGTVDLEATYDALARPLTFKRFGKLKQTITYYTASVSDQLGTLASISDGRDGAGFDTTMTLSNWKRGVPQTVGYPATVDQPAVTQTSVVGDDGTVSSTTDENGYTTSYLYDEMDRLKQINYPTGDSPAWAVTTQAFATSPDANFGLPVGHWERTVKTGNGTKIVHFDAFWRPVVEESFDNGSPTLATNTHSYVVKRYDTTGRLVFQSYPLRTLSDYTSVTAGVTTTYDALDRVKKTSVPSTDSSTGTFVTTTAYASDATGAYTLVTDPRTNQTKTWFQMFDQPDYSRPVKITQPEGVITDIARDVFGKPTSMTRHDASNSVVSTRTYTYNASQELCRTVEPETGATLMGYDAAGNLAWSAAGYASTAACGGPENVAARRVDRTYDARSRLKTLVFPDHLGDTTTTYTPDGLVASLVADNGSSNVVTTAYTYNRRRLLIGERMTWNAINWPIVYGYDANGNAASLTYPDSTYVDYAPNALGQATKVGTYATNVTYHPNGAIAQFNYGNGIVHAMTQNDRQLPDRSRDAFDGAPAVVALDDNYSYDGNGNVVAILDGIAGAPSDRTMEYDGLNRLTKATSPLFNDGTANEARYSYDVLDNISTVHMRDRNQFYCYDTATWRLTNIKSGYCSSGATVVGLGYDVQGNVTNKNGQMFAFDYGNRLRSTSNNSTPVSSYVYDGLGRRVRDYTTASKYSLYSKDGRIVYASDGRTGKVTTNIYLGNSLLAEMEKDAVTSVITTRYMHTDALGSVVALSSANRYLNRNSYEPYGELINRANYDRPGFTGHIMDAATGLTYAQQRYYDPEIGRFLSADPVTADPKNGSNFNRYKYANDNPYRFNDPDGRYDCVASSAQCSQFDRGVALINKAAANARGDAKIVLNGILKTLGKKGDGNGVSIKSTSEGAGSWRGLAKGGDLKVNFEGLNKVASNLGQKGQDFMVASTATHEGWHGWWERLTRAAGTYEANSRSFETADETRAGISEGILAQSLGIDHPQKFWTRQGGFDMGKIQDQAADSVSQYCRLGCGE